MVDDACAPVEIKRMEAAVRRQRAIPIEMFMVAGLGLRKLLGFEELGRACEIEVLGNGIGLGGDWRA
jgi:hypothetical protein